MSIAKEIRDLMARCSRLEQQVAKLPTRIGNSAGGGGTGGNDREWMVFGDSFAELPEVDEVDVFARVTDGEFKGMTCVVNADADGWVPFTHFG